MQQSDVLAATVTATGSVVSGRQRVKGIYLVAGSSAGSVVLRDGSGSGSIRLDLATPAGVDEIYIPVPDQGILFSAGVHATLTNVSALTVFYG